MFIKVSNIIVFLLLFIFQNISATKFVISKIVNCSNEKILINSIKLKKYYLRTEIFNTVPEIISNKYHHPPANMDYIKNYLEVLITRLNNPNSSQLGFELNSYQTIHKQIPIYLNKIVCLSYSGKNLFLFCHLNQIEVSDKSKLIYSLITLDSTGEISGSNWRILTFNDKIQTNYLTLIILGGSSDDAILQLPE